MLAYVLLAAVPLVYLFFLRILRNSTRLSGLPADSSMLNLFFFLCFLIHALRAQVVGVDVPNYLAKYLLVDHLSWREWMMSSSWEPGFMVLTKLIGIVSDHRQIYLAAIAAVILFPMGWFYSRESEGPVLTMALFLILPVFGMLFTGLRQSISIMLAIPAYCFTRERKLVPFLLTVVGAVLFHLSAVILILMYPVYHMRLPRRALTWILPLLAVVYLFSGRIFAVLLSVLSMLYSDNDWTVQSTGAYSMLLLFGMLMIFSYLFIQEDTADAELLGQRNLLVLSVFLQCFASVNSLAMRMNYYFLLFLPVLIPRVIRQAAGIKALICKIANVVLCTFFLFYFFRQAAAGSSGFRIFPYVPFWAA